MFPSQPDFCLIFFRSIVSDDSNAITGHTKATAVGHIDIEGRTAEVIDALYCTVSGASVPSCQLPGKEIRA